MQLVSAAIAMLERNHARAYLQPLPKPEWRQIIVARDLEVGKKPGKSVHTYVHGI